MSEQQKEIEVYQSNLFEKQLKKLSEQDLSLVEDEIDKVIENPEIGERKKGDLSYLWVHKFKMNGQLVLLGYSWQETKFELYLLSVGPHENFYENMKTRRKADLKLIS